jgi:hypothetical protein
MPNNIKTLIIGHSYARDIGKELVKHIIMRCLSPVNKINKCDFFFSFLILNLGRTENLNQNKLTGFILSYFSFITKRNYLILYYCLCS